MYTMATVYLNRTKKQFWKMTPRETVTLIREYKKIEIYRLKLQAFVNSGGDPDEVGSKEAVRQKELEMGAAMW